MIFEINGWNNRTIEVDDLLDIIDLIQVDGAKILSNGKLLAEYDTTERAKEVFEELCNTFEEGIADFYNFPER